jgi:hypothetical protein
MSMDHGNAEPTRRVPAASNLNMKSVQVVAECVKGVSTA